MSAASAQYNNWLQTNDTAAFESTWLFVTCSRRLLPKTNLRGFFSSAYHLLLSFALFVLFCLFICEGRVETFDKCIIVLGAPDCVKAKSLVSVSCTSYYPLSRALPIPLCVWTVAPSFWCHRAIFGVPWTIQQLLCVQFRPPLTPYFSVLSCQTASSFQVKTNEQACFSYMCVTLFPWLFCCCLAHWAILQKGAVFKRWA